MSSSIPTHEIEHYLRTGSTDPCYLAWPGRNVIEKGERAVAVLRAALIGEMKKRAQGRPPAISPADLNVVAFTRGRVEPMVRGLFPRIEQEPVLAMLQRAVVFVTADNIEQLLLTAEWDSTAWNLANLFLESVGAGTLGPDDRGILGLSEETTCYVSTRYFEASDRFADWVVHEAAHVFHNCKRRTVCLQETRRREWLLDIDFRKRETFAYLH